MTDLDKFMASCLLANKHFGMAVRRVSTERKIDGEVRENLILARDVLDLIIAGFTPAVPPNGDDGKPMPAKRAT